MIRRKKQLSATEALVKAEDLCSAAEYCTDDILKKLDRWGISLSDSQKILAELQRKKYIDNFRFAVAFSRDKYRFQRWGRRKISLALYQKRIESSLIADAMAEAIDSDEYYEILLSLLKSKARSVAGGNSYEGRTRLFRFAASRGFETDLISRAIKTGNLFEIPE